MKKIFSTFCLLSLTLSTYWYTQKQLNSANTLADRWIIVKQSDPTLYKLDNNITRKEFMKVFVNLKGEPVQDTCNGYFRDVLNDWGCKYIEWSLKWWHIARNDDFRPNDSITKAETMKLILKARGIDRIQNGGDWRFVDMLTAYKKWIIEDPYYDYDTIATRGWIFEIAATPEGTYEPQSWGGSGGIPWPSSILSPSSSSVEDIPSPWSTDPDNCTDWRCLVP